MIGSVLLESDGRSEPLCARRRSPTTLADDDIGPRLVTPDTRRPSGNSSASSDDL
jgi:hypothetical protein